MISTSRRPCLALSLAMALGIALTAAMPGPARGQGAGLDARTIISRYFEAIGGRDKIENVKAMVVHGRYGSVYAPGDTMTLFLKKPDLLRRETFGLIVTFDGSKGYINSFGDLKEAEGDNLTSLRYYAGFFHNCFSLLKFGNSLERASYAGERTLGPQREYVVTVPYEGTDYEVHFDAGTYLIDRIVFPFGDPERGTRMVNSLANYKDVNGVMIPMEVTFDVVGRESAGMMLEPLDVEFVDDLDDSMFEAPQMDIAAPSMEGGVLVSEVFDDSNGVLLTTVRREHMEKLGIAPGEFMTFRVGADTMSVRYVEDIHSGFKGAGLGDYIAIYYGTPLLAILMFGEGQLSDVVPFEKGQRIEIWPTKSGGN